MTRAIIKLVIKSQEPEEIRPGVFKHRLTLIDNVPANEVRTPIARLNNAQSINPNTTYTNSFSVLFANDLTNRYSRIVHVWYSGVLYDVSSITPYPPRVTIDLGDKSTDTLESLGLVNQNGTT